MACQGTLEGTQAPLVADCAAVAKANLAALAHLQDGEYVHAAFGAIWFSFNGQHVGIDNPIKEKARKAHAKALYEMRTGLHFWAACLTCSGPKRMDASTE